MRNYLKKKKYVLKSKIVCIGRNFKSPFIHIPPNLSWIFIFGCYNSGTTLLNHILSGHPEISGLKGEGVDYTKYLEKPEDYYWPRMWLKCEKEMLVDEKKWVEEKIKKDWLIYHDVSRKYLIEKSVSNTSRIEWFKEHFNNPTFIGMIRNGYAVVEGIRRRTKGKLPHKNPFYRENEYPLELCIKQWVRSNELIYKHFKNYNNSVLIKYEDLTNNPEKELNKIYKLLKINNVDLKSDINFNFHNKKYSKIKNMNIASINNLDEYDIKLINKMAGQELLKYNYEVIEI
ncbi:MAG TPA: sulfotransferase [Bacteroidales bacterium]|nr:sulfotransferase [Bacteroidales bacterium]